MGDPGGAPNFPMQTGHNLVDSNGGVEIDHNLELNVTATVLAFTEKAVNLAATYVEHSGRRVVTPGDIRKGMAAEYFAFLDDTTLEEDVAGWRGVLEKDLDCCQCETDDDEEIPENDEGDPVCPRCGKVVVYEDESEFESELEDPQGEGESREGPEPDEDRPECPCKVCSAFRVAEGQLLCYTPQDHMAALLRDNILRMPTG